MCVSEFLFFFGSCHIISFPVMELDGAAMQWQWHRASSRCESVTVARTAHPQDVPSEGMGRGSPSIIKADLRERVLPHGEEKFEKM